MDKEQFMQMLNALDGDERRKYAELALGPIVERTLYPHTLFNRVEILAIGNEFAETAHRHVLTLYNCPGYNHPRTYWAIEQLANAFHDARKENPDEDSQEELDKAYNHLIYYIKERQHVPWYNYPVRSRSTFYQFPRE